MVRTYKRKTKRASTTPDMMLKAVRQVLVFKKTIRAAAEEFGINYRTLARYCTKIPREEVEGDAEHPSCTVGFIGARQVFNPESETELISCISRASDIYYSLPPKAIRKLSYQLAKRHQLHMPASWRENKQASADWFTAFLKRHPTLRVRSAEPSSRCAKDHAEMFYSKLKELTERHRFKPEDVWNMDEMGISTSQRADRVVVRRGQSQLGCASDRGPLVSVACAVSATGNTIPPYFVFPRVQFREHFLTGAPVGSSGGANLNGWMREEQFLEFLQHFTRHTGCSPVRPCLLLLDTHVSHLSIEGLCYAKSNSVVMLSFPPHCPQSVQPLERSVYEPFKKCVNAAIDSWMLGGPGRSLTIHHIPGIVSSALPLAVAPDDITDGFKACGVFPLDTNTGLLTVRSQPSVSSRSEDTSECERQPTADKLHFYQRLKNSEKDGAYLHRLS
ncbi:hypothetical protein E1301_Tti024293 [Triplophysa tibetana]|uniref:Uncharacterized protein n=1 Tax=Triplophysa tibetana TaxID=1572043 RepID=A0A5A9PJ35_9TELE|nr:hypothetical protein E1301_Tti024293 [Triplophysa tibetana]